MIVLAVLVALELLELHGPDGQLAYVNVHEITALRSPTKQDMARYFAKSAGCIVTLTDAKFLAVTETCDQIRAKIGK